MGEARERSRALSRGQPWPQDRHRCPVCRSRRTAVEPMPPMGLTHITTLVGVCGDCKTMWEAYPDDWRHDVVEANPCDNCAFRPDSPEIRSREEWRALLAKLKAGGEFKCHKGAPILIDAQANTIEFDAAWVNRLGRTCAGFHRAIMTRPGWLEARYPGAFEEVVHDQ